MPCTDLGNVAANQHDPAWWQRSERSGHPLPEVASALRDDTRAPASSRPDWQFGIPIRRHINPGPPSWIMPKTNKQTGERIAIEAPCRNHANLAAEPAFGNAKPGRLGEDDEMVGHRQGRGLNGGKAISLMAI